jgi:hypothetical protein
MNTGSSKKIESDVKEEYDDLFLGWLFILYEIIFYTLRTAPENNRSC